MGTPPPSYYSVQPSAPSMDHPPPRPPPSNPTAPMAYPTASSSLPPVYTQPVMVPYGVPMQSAPAAPVTNIVIQSGGGSPGVTVAGGDKRLCPKCKQGILIYQRNKCIKVVIIVLLVITFPFGILLLPFLCCIWQLKCAVCGRVAGPPIGLKKRMK